MSPFGVKYVSDFVSVQLWSTINRMILIEMESPHVRPLTKKCLWARRLTEALQQVTNCFAWIREN